MLVACRRPPDTARLGSLPRKAGDGFLSQQMKPAAGTCVDAVLGDLVEVYGVVSDDRTVQARACCVQADPMYEPMRWLEIIDLYRKVRPAPSPRARNAASLSWKGLGEVLWLGRFRHCSKSAARGVPPCRVTLPPPAPASPTHTHTHTQTHGPHCRGVSCVHVPSVPLVV